MGISGINAYTADCAAVRARAVGAGHAVVEREANQKSLLSLRSSTPGSATSKDPERPVFLENEAKYFGGCRRRTPYHSHPSRNHKSSAQETC